MNEAEKQKATENPVGFLNYCLSVGELPVEDTDNWNRLLRAWLAWSAASEQEYPQNSEPV